MNTSREVNMEQSRREEGRFWTHGLLRALGGERFLRLGAFGGVAVRWELVDAAGIVGSVACRGENVKMSGFPFFSCPHSTIVCF